MQQQNYRSIFRPCLTVKYIALTNVENAIRQQLPLLSLPQRYELLDKWNKILTPIISRLDPEQGKLLSV